MNVMKEEQKIVIYQTEDGQTQIDVRLENETVWLTQAQMAELFQTTKQNVSLHLYNLYKEGELQKKEQSRNTWQLAAMLLYLVTKNHSFSDGNKRVAATLLLWLQQKI